MGNSSDEGNSEIQVLRLFWLVRPQIPHRKVRVPVIRSVPCWVRLFTVSLLILLLASYGRLSAEPCIYELDNGGKVVVQLDTMYDIAPRKGFLPLTFKIENSSSKTQTVKIKATSTIHRMPSWGLLDEVTISKDDVTTLNVTLPLDDGWSESGGALKIEYDYNNFGIRRRSERALSKDQPENSCLINIPANVAPELSLYSNGTVTLFPENTLLKRRKGFMVQTIPDSWYQLKGVTNVWLTEEEWKTLTSEKQTMLLDWVKSGGVIYTVDPQRVVESLHEVGLGRVIGTARSPDAVSQSGNISEKQLGSLSVYSPSTGSPLDRMRELKDQFAYYYYFTVWWCLLWWCLPGTSEFGQH